jgi:hypothetical protein
MTIETSHNMIHLNFVGIGDVCLFVLFSLVCHIGFSDIALSFLRGAIIIVFIFCFFFGFFIEF